MRSSHGWYWLALGVTLGALVMSLRHGTPRQALAGNDRHEDFIMCTGQIQLAPNLYADTVWMLDYRGGRLLGTVVDRTLNKLLPWQEVDLVKEFNIAPKQNVHFMMTTGQPSVIPSNAFVGPVFQPPIAVLPPASSPAAGGNVPPPMGTPPPASGTPTPPPPLPLTNPGLTTANFRVGQAPLSAVGTLFVAETTTGRFAVYTIAPHPDPRVGLVILRHDATRFRVGEGDK